MEDGLGSRLLETRNEDQQQKKKSSFLRYSVIFGSVFIIAVCVSAILLQTTPVEVRTDADETPKRVSRGPSLGVSEKSVGNSLKPYQWTNAELQWQRTAYHFQPEKNWMNDPNGPLVYKGWYHLFYQYNPDAAVWGNITWGHAVSKDLVHWKLLGLAMVPDHWYDINGVWTGSATFLRNGEIIMLYTGSTNESVQVQNLAVPKNLSDPLLIEWVKSPANPVLTPPKGIGYKDFRDPTTGWTGPDGAWRIAIGSKIGTTGIVLVYKTEDFINYELDGNMHGVPGTGMWECVDFYPIAESGSPVGLDTSVNGAGVKHVLKASLDDDKHDYYAIGTYNETSGTFTPDNPEIDVGIGLRYDYGKYYASKTFYDQEKQRRILWGWIAETDSEQADILKGWASVQTVPRAVWFDSKTRTNIIQWPVKEVESLRSNDTSLNDVVLTPGSVIQINTSNAAQLDIEIEFEFPDEEVLKNSREQLNYEDVVYNCSTSGGAESRGVLGPFGLLALADESRTEQTALYFYIAKAPNGNLKTFFCHDESRSSLASDLILGTHGSSVPVLEDEKTIKLRTLIDHSIIESYAQGGRTCITSRIYPTEAIDKAAKLFLFNNATTTIKVSNANVWKMKSALIGPFEE